METESSSFNNGGSDFSFLSLLMAGDTMTQTPNEFHLQGELPPLPPSFDTSPTHFLSPDYSTLLFPSSDDYFPIFNPTGFHGDYGLKNLKIEQPCNRDNLYSSLSSSAALAPALMNQDIPARALPELLSLETLTQPVPLTPNKESSYLPQPKRPKNSRQKMTEKMYSLGKLLPGSHHRRPNAVEVLEETHKYIRFLQAQVAALKSMPTESRVAVGGKGAVEAGLGRLSRQQLLQVVVNSPGTQSLMAEKGWCVVASEQVALMKKIEVRKNLIQHLLNHLPL